MKNETNAQPVSGDELMTCAEVADGCRVALNTVYQWVKRGHIPASKLGGAIRIKRADFEEFKASATVRPAGAAE